MTKPFGMELTPQQQESTDFTEISSFLFNPVNTSIAFVEFVFSLIFNILRAACVPAELIFRRGFGERHFNLWLYFSGSIWLMLFATGWINIPKWLGYSVTGWMPNFAIFLVVGVIFFASMVWQLFLRKFKKIDGDLHTRYDGTPLPFLYRLPYAKDRNGNPREYLIRQTFEPLFLLVLGLVLTITLNPQTGSWLIISSVGLALKEYVKSRFIRNAILDHIDAEIAARNIKAALAGEPPSKTQGIYIAGLPNEGRERDKLRELFEQQGSRFSATQTTQATPES